MYNINWVCNWNIIQKASCKWHKIEGECKNGGGKEENIQVSDDSAVQANEPIQSTLYSPIVPLPN